MILIVDDDPKIRTFLSQGLTESGMVCETAGDGESALAMVRERRFDLVLLDVMLPGMSGFDVCRRLREELPQLPILMLTARGAESDVLEGFRAGADDYVTKPFSVSELLARVEALLLARADEAPIGRLQAPRKERNDRNDRRDGKPRRENGPRDRAPREGMTRYRVSVGHKDGVKPGQLVGALANEGGST